MDLIILTLYLGYFLLILGTIGVITGPKVNDPLNRLLNIEVPSLGLMLIFLAYNQTLALMTYIAINSIITLVFVRTIIKNGELEA
ncbi:MAG TPA: DUF2107 domain-containing protein [Methanothermococcus okinawensis]|uniref:DUF2107 domain-containing protein n=1 Tax=Methanothermococcus okinawensis TaxID=155863 RepID=A0A832YTA7_9EURY|nr:DUF2107 domain-containing protein [Methanothermococcus okinawensis]